MGLFERFRSLLLVVEPDAELDATLAAAQRFAHAAVRAHWLCLPGARDASDEDEAGAAADASRLSATLSTIQARHPALSLSYSLDTGLHAANVIKTADELSADLVVLGPLRRHSARERASLLLRLSARHGRHVLSLGTGFSERAVSQVAVTRLAVAIDEAAAALPALADLLSSLEHDVQVSAWVTGASALRRAEIAAMFEAHDPARPIAVHALDGSSLNLAAAIDDTARSQSVDLVVGAADAVSDLEALAFGFLAASTLQHAWCPLLVLPRTQAVPLYLRERLVASDALLLPGVDPQLAVERVGAFGRAALAEGEQLAVFHRGVEHLEVPHQEGALTLPHAWFADGPREHALVVETRGEARESAAARLLRPEKPVILLEASIEELPAGSLAGPASAHQLVFVRMRRGEDLQGVRERFGRYQEEIGIPVVVDASAWLDDAGAEDVPSIVDGQRLLRVALRMQASGLLVTAVVTREQHLRTAACQALTAQQWPGFSFTAGPSEPSSSASSQTSDPLWRELDTCTSAPATPGHSVDIALENAAARRNVLQQIAEAKQRIHWQCYMVEDDATTAQFAEALLAAAERGVQVRFLVDAVYSLHQAFGRQNSFLARLTASAGVAVHAFRPVLSVPNLSALKRRNHRKCILFDGRLAVVTGRNLGAPYYRGFHEVQLSTTSSYRDVPWLDAGAAFQGPLVEGLERSFAREWERAGGDAYAILPASAAGDLTARLVLHDGLRDTHTFDAQLALIRHARRELTIVNNFPLVLELQRALVAALARGVRVRVLFGSVRPHFGQGVPFSGGGLRSLADQLVRARLDPVIAAGGEACEYALPALPDWDPRLSRVFPHVHAKLLVRDRTDVAIGSANLDVTAAYWESEAMLIVHDAAFAQALEAELDAHFASARLVDRRSELHLGEAAQRAWLSRYWPSLIG